MEFPEFNKQEFDQWFIDNVDAIYKATGIAHYNAQDVGIVKMLFLQQLQINQLEQQLDVLHKSIALNKKTDAPK